MLAIVKWWLPILAFLVLMTWAIIKIGKESNDDNLMDEHYNKPVKDSKPDESFRC